ncbi:MAG: hypothetical protein A2X05_11895 [Bacteroidetes bacterium GWE2_41_25]|nr:MAG: hypothetical protein A2X03_02765 [Bacteroidetes bacterium GWA2_40_15]OFX92469.1 MAG: hypothetical protein A2X06_05935 [Bacteroidetes bacterium GWC2_40_22]OFX92611.1 MAG: hypothetical protein A2X05_11895 [Bacteroidetes bacterium GWE2_41_25]OFY58330.1 MAG: hypothetical protein A2X04_12750 [Bacteroidetes bacterium GWF2_41_9]HAM10992.1 hypothetical protein [Bacteroidales bacterium]
MSNSFLKRHHILLLIFLLIYSCAKIGRPTGGPRDRVPPVVVKTLPGERSINFSGDELLLTLDEYVVLDNINENLLVSPPMKQKPKVWLKGKSVVVELQEDLKDSTTYTFNFQNAIKDLNEGNILEGYQFVFSTGPVLDSLSVTGNVYSAENLDLAEKAFVLMHSELADSAVKKHLPDYLSIIDKNGYFRINNVKPGSYRLYALNDADNNKTYNLKDEEFAFLSSLLEVTADSNWLPIVKDTVKVIREPVARTNAQRDLKKKIQDTVVLTGKNKLLLFVQAPTARYLKSSERKMKYRLEYVLSLPPDSLDFKIRIPDTDSSSYFIENSRQRDTMTVWITDTTIYGQNQITTYLKYPFTDTSDMIVYKEDTVMLRFVAPKEIKGTRIKKPLSLPVLNNIPAGSVKPGQKIIFSSETPLKEPDTTLIRLYDVTTKDTLKIPYVFVKDSLTATKYLFVANILSEKKYFFVADSSAFFNYFGECSDSIGIRMSLKPADSYSKLTFNIRNGEGDMIIQLLDKTEKIVREGKINGDGKIDFPLIEAGLYRARVIFDYDGNGKWTTGDFSAGRQPEPVSYYPTEIEIKAKFELEQDWDVAVKYVKDVKMRLTKSKAAGSM